MTSKIFITTRTKEIVLDVRRGIPKVVERLFAANIPYAFVVTVIPKLVSFI